MVRSEFILVILVGSIFWTAGWALECYSCSGDACSNPNTYLSTATCGTTDVGCYAIFDGLTASERGCLNATATCTDSCGSCTGDKCNGNSAPSHKCISCSSVTDANCIGNAASLTSVQCEAVTIDVTDVQCYTRVIGVATERGCIVSQADLDAADSANYSQTCTGEGCNSEVFPASRKQCVKCDSSSCDTSTTIDTSSYCDDPDDGCVVLKRTDGTTYKNCQQSMSTADKQLCESNSTNCALCIGQQCNTQTLAALKAAGQRVCYSCEGNNCLRSSVTLETCKNSDDNCYSLFDGYNAIQRGCYVEITDTTTKSACEASDASCTKCSSANGCNLVSNVGHICYSCSSVLSTACITGTDLTSMSCPAATTEVTEDAQCYTRVIGSVTERGCLGSPTDDALCTPGVNCQRCAIGTGACNSGLYPADRRKCVVNSVTNTYCGNPSDSCVQIARNSTTITKKCKTAMTATEVSFCASNSNKCEFCNTDNCNQQTSTFNYNNCISCNSISTSQCLSAPTNITTVEKCTTSCAAVMATTSGSQYVRRGCSSSLTTAEQSICNTTSNANCITCTGNRCNTGIVPASRLACYTCLSGNCSSQSTITLQYCPTYVAGDICVVQTDSQGLLLRMGCKSSLTAQQSSECTVYPARCKTCNTTQCNEPSLYLPRAACVHCNSVYDPDCETRASNFEAEPCANPLNTQCYSRLIGNGKTERGCLSDLANNDRIRCLAGANCAVCTLTSGACNNQKYPESNIRCYQCDSTQDSTCKASQIGKNATTCATYNVYNQCFTIVQANGDTVRKCSASSRDVVCAGSELCEVCSFNGCNNRESTDITAYVTTTTTAATTTPSSAMRPLDRGSWQIVMAASLLTLIIATLLVDV